MQKILVTGCAGFIGSHVIDTLLKRKQEVIGIDNFDPYYNVNQKKANITQALKNPQFKFFELDIRDAKNLETQLAKKNIAKIIHIAAKAGVRASVKDPISYLETNVLGTANILNFTRKNEIRQVICASSSSIYGASKNPEFRETDITDSPLSPYAASKKAMEVLCYSYTKAYDLDIVCLRFFTVYGPRGRPDMFPYKLIHSLANDLTFEKYGDGTSKRDYTYIDDIVSGVLASLNYKTKFDIFNLGNNKPIELNEMIRVGEEITGKKAKFIEKPMPAADVPVTCANIDKAKRHLGFLPKTDIRTGMKRFYEWYLPKNRAP